MRTTLFTLLCLFVAIGSFAQDKNSGKVIYEKKIKLKIELQGQAAQFAHLLPKEQISKKVLLFNEMSSIFRDVKEEDETMTLNSGQSNVVVKMINKEEAVQHTDLETRKTLEQREFFTRTFLIEGEAILEWKITGKQKMILGFPCQEALAAIDSMSYTAWFTTAIPVSAGPNYFSGLPGLVLAVESEHLSITAKNVSFFEPEKNQLAKPADGKKVSSEEFELIVQEKMKEMQEEYGVENGTVIKMHGH